VSFSDPYYTANQAVLGYPTGAAANVTSLSDLKGLKLGAATSTTSLTFITDVIQPDSEPFIYNSNADAKTALDNQQIDAIVADLPTALYITGVEITDAKVFGQFPIDAGGAGESWGLLFAKDNPLVECANLALAALTASGELAAITEQWMGDYNDAPTLSAS
jgi:polar amino acid transport system substrate-binding protein